MAYFGIGPSLQVGIIKDAIREAVLDGIIPNQHEAAYNYMIKLGTEMGLTAIGKS